MPSQQFKTDFSPRRGSQEDGPPGLLLIGHGTRDRKGQAEFFELASRVQARLPHVSCEACSLEFAEPTIADGLSRLAERGVIRVTAMPLLLFAAGHVQQDIPAALARASSRTGGIEVDLVGCLGCHPALVELSARRFEEAMDATSSSEDRDGGAGTLLLMVGRGSHDTQANAEMIRFAHLRSQRTPLGGVEVCYAAMAEPSLEQGLEHASQSPFDRIVVQPHLLFRGELLQQVRRAVEVRRAKRGKQWFVTEHLGPHDLVVDAVLQITAL